MTFPLQGGVLLHPLKAVYLAVLVFSIVALAVMNYWVETRASTSRIQHVVTYHNVSILWGLVAAVGLLVGSRQVSLPLVYLRTALSYAVVILFVRFATLYSGRSTSLRRPFNAAFVAGMGLGLAGLLTQPWLGLHFDPLLFHTEPFPYYETGLGPAWQFSLLVSYIGIAAGLYYLLELFVTSQHRSSRPLVVYVLGLGLSVLPSMLTAAGQVPTLPGYDHSVLGLGTASIAFFLGAWLGMAKIAPISRDRLLATTEDGLIVVDGDGLVADFNPVATQFFTEEDVIGRPLADVAPAVTDPIPDADLAAVSGTDAPRIELTHAVDGQERVYSVEISAVTDVETVRGHALVLREVTERHRNREELRRQNEQLDDFASSISHHLRNPLQVAAGQAELAREAFAAAEDQSTTPERVDDLEQSLERMGTIITDLRTLAKQGKSVESTGLVRLSEAVDAAGAHVDDGDWTLTVERDGTIRADHGRLLSILENLLRNSIEHAGPAVEITVSLTDDGFVFRDDGPGVEADRERLFEYGFTTSSEGTGLGLSIVETMAESHGWRVHVDRDHDGARFVVTGAVTDVEPTAAD